MMTWQNLMAAGRYEEARQGIEQEIAKNPDQPELQEQLGLAYYHLKKIVKAEACFVQAFEQTPTLQGLYYVVVVKYDLKKYGDVIQAAEKFVKLDGGIFEVWDMLGDSYYAEGRYDKALACFTKAGQIDHHQEMIEKINNIQKQMQSISKKENERLKQWADDFYKVSKYGEAGRKRQALGFPGLFRDQIMEYKIIEKLLEHNFTNLSAARVLDVGCGEGRWLRQFIDWGAEPAQLAGIDINEDIINLAKRLSAPEIDFSVATADELPFKDQSFDIILTFGVLQHIKQSELQRKIGCELLRILSRDGIILTYNINKRGHDRLQSERFVNKTTIGIDGEVLQNFFPDCEISYEEGFLGDMLVYSVIPNDWGMLYERAVSSRNFNHQFGLAVIKEKS